MRMHRNSISISISRHLHVLPASRKAQFSGRCFSRPTWLRLAELLSPTASATTSLPTTLSSSSQWTRQTQPIWLTPQTQCIALHCTAMFGRRATLVPLERLAAQRWQAWFSRYRHCRPAEVRYRSLYVCHSWWILATHLARSQHALCHTGQSASVRESHQSGRQGVRLPHARSALCVSLADARTRHDNCSSIVATWIDYCNSLLYGAPAATIDTLSRV